MATSPLVPSRLPIAVEDHPYLMEPSGFRRQTVPVLRQQADQSTEPGEQSLNPQGLWRRSQESWHHGAGQEFLDGRDEQAADPHRFRSSKGVDVWTRGQVSLLHPVLKNFATTNTNLHLAVAQQPATGYFVLCVADDTEMYGAGLPYNLFNAVAVLQGTGWTATNATIAVSGMGFSLTATAADVISATSPTGTAGIPVEGGRHYGGAFQSIFDTGNPGAARNQTLTVNWYDSTGALVSSSGTAVSASPDSGFSGTAVFGTFAAPATAAYAALVLSYQQASVIGEVHHVRTASLGPYEDVSTLGAPDSWFTNNIQAGQAAQSIRSLATNGTHVWAALGTSGIHLNIAGNGFSTADAPAAPVGGNISLVGFANGYLLAAGSDTSTTRRNVLWRVDNPLTTPTLVELKEHDNSSFVWTGIAPGRNVVYAYGNSGGNGEVYKITFDPNTGTLASAASFATYLPDGETIHALCFYAGGIIMGTGKGLRLGQADAQGSIDYGPLIETEWPVHCLEPQGRYCWFGWTKYDEETSGLGRIDLGFFTDTLTPAWASDLMTPDASSGDVVACVTYSPYGYTAFQRPPVRVFAVAGEGIYIEDPGSRVPSGQVETGTIRYSTSEPKIARSLDVRHHALPEEAGVTVDRQVDTSGTWTPVGGSSTVGSFGSDEPLNLGPVTGEAFEFRFTLGRSPVDNDFAQSPELTRWTAKVLPRPSSIDETFTVPLILKSKVEDLNGAAYPVDVAAEVAYLKGLERDRTIVNLQLGDEEHDVFIVASEFEGQHWGEDRASLEGIYTAQFQTVRG